jgi:hypothetical protein
MTLSYTQFFKFGIPDFLTGPWHGDFGAMVRAIDSVLYNNVILNGATIWANSTAYLIGHVVISPDDGTVYICAIAHTSAVSPTTFSADRIAHPTFWTSLTSALAILIAYTPSGTLISLNVQAAIDELELNKAPRYPGVQIVTVAGAVVVANSTGKLILNKSAPSVTPVQLPLMANFTLNELLISDFAGNSGDITITPGAGEKIGGLAANAPWVIGSGGAGLGGSIRLSKVVGVGWAVG